MILSNKFIKESICEKENLPIKVCPNVKDHLNGEENGDLIGKRFIGSMFDFNFF